MNMSIIRVQNTSNARVVFFANTNKEIEQKLKHNGIDFTKHKEGSSQISFPAQKIIEVLDGDITRSELNPMVKGKVIKDVTDATEYLSVGTTKEALLSEIKELQLTKDKLIAEINELQASKQK